MEPSASFLSGRVTSAKFVSSMSSQALKHLSAKASTGMVRMLEYVPFHAFLLKKLTSLAFIFPFLLFFLAVRLTERDDTVPLFLILVLRVLGTIVQQFVQRGSSYVAETADAAEDARHVVGFV